MILFEDNHFLVAEKPSNCSTQPHQNTEDDLETQLKEVIKKRDQKPGNVFLHCVHRLDKPVSGIVVFAKSQKALSRLNQSQREKKWVKIYEALVEGAIEKEQTLSHYLVKKSHHAEVSHKDDPLAKHCILEYRILEKRKSTTRIQVKLASGRYHQIRAQLSAIKHPIIGDVKYGAKKVAMEGIALHHSFVSFPHPITKEILEFENSSPF